MSSRLWVGCKTAAGLQGALRWRTANRELSTLARRHRLQGAAGAWRAHLRCVEHLGLILRRAVRAAGGVSPKGLKTAGANIGNQERTTVQVPQHTAGLPALPAQLPNATGGKTVRRMVDPT